MNKNDSNFIGIIITLFVLAGLIFLGLNLVPKLTQKAQEEKQEKQAELLTDIKTQKQICIEKIYEFYNQSAWVLKDLRKGGKKVSIDVSAEIGMNLVKTRQENRGYFAKKTQDEKEYYTFFQNCQNPSKREEIYKANKEAIQTKLKKEAKIEELSNLIKNSKEECESNQKTLEEDLTLFSGTRKNWAKENVQKHAQTGKDAVEEKKELTDLSDNDKENLEYFKKLLN